MRKTRVKPKEESLSRSNFDQLLSNAALRKVQYNEV